MEARDTKAASRVPWVHCTKLSYRCKLPTQFLAFSSQSQRRGNPGKFNGNQSQDGRQAGRAPATEATML